MQLRKNRETERTAVNAARTFFEAHGCVFQEVDLANDYGKDTHLDLTEGRVVTGTCIAVQIKGGDSAPADTPGIERPSRSSNP